MSKKITSKNMYKRVNLLGHEKLMENTHKENLLSLDSFELFEELRVEIAEFNKAFRYWQTNKSLKNKNNMDREAGDVVNYLSALISKTDGFNNLIRE